jgi:hypothetical protein
MKQRKFLGGVRSADGDNESDSEAATRDGAREGLDTPQPSVPLNESVRIPVAARCCCCQMPRAAGLLPRDASQSAVCLFLPVVRPSSRIDPNDHSLSEHIRVDKSNNNDKPIRLLEVVLVQKPWYVKKPSSLFWYVKKIGLSVAAILRRLWLFLASFVAFRTSD